MGYKEARLAILDKYDYDIDRFKPVMKGKIPVSKDDIKKYSPKSLIAGIEVEIEHSYDVGIRLEIALAHLNERGEPYYPLLKKYVEGK